MHEALRRIQATPPPPPIQKGALAALFDNRQLQQKNSECRELRVWDSDHVLILNASRTRTDISFSHGLTRALCSCILPLSFGTIQIFHYISIVTMQLIWKLNYYLLCNLYSNAGTEVFCVCVRKTWSCLWHFIIILNECWALVMFNTMALFWITGLCNHRHIHCFNLKRPQFKHLICIGVCVLGTRRHSWKKKKLRGDFGGIFFTLLHLWCSWSKIIGLWKIAYHFWFIIQLVLISTGLVFF